MKDPNTYNQRVLSAARSLSRHLQLMYERTEEIIKRMDAIEALPDWREKIPEWNELERQLRLLRVEMREAGHSY